MADVGCGPSSKTRNSVPYVLVSPRGMLVRSLVQRKSPELKQAWISLVESPNLEEAAVVHVTNEHSEADELAKFGFKLRDVRVVPNGVDLPADGDAGQVPSTAIADLAAGPPYLLFVGRINWKGLGRLIEASALIPDIRLIVAGNDEESYQPALEALAERHQVSGRIRFAGPAYGEDKQALFRHATALVVPSYSENFGNVALEAMAAGCRSSQPGKSEPRAL